MRLTLTILTLYAFLLQAVLAGAAGGAPADVTHQPLCASRAAPAAPARGPHHDQGGTCCAFACRIGLVGLPPPLSNVPYPRSSIVTAAPPIWRAIPNRTAPVAATRARSPPHLV